MRVLLIFIIIVIFLLILFLLNFYRDPKRRIPKGNNIVSPADGKIINILKIKSNKTLKNSKGIFGVPKNSKNFSSIIKINYNKNKLPPRTKAQFAIEFIVLIAFMFLIFVGFIAVITTKILESKDNERQEIEEDIAELEMNEIVLAKSVTDGYLRTFNLPTRIKGNTYSIEIIDNRELIVNYVDKEVVLFLPPNIQGDVDIGLNEIKKIDGIVYLNNIEPPISLILLMKGAINAISFKINGDVVLKRDLKEGASSIELTPTSDDEFIFKDSSGNVVTIINLITGDMFIKGSLKEQQVVMSNQPTDDFIVKESSGNIVAYIDNLGDFYLKGKIEQNGFP